VTAVCQEDGKYLDNVFLIYYYICIKRNANIMEQIKKEIPADVPKFLRKVIQDKKDIKEALKDNKSLSDLAKEKNIKFGKLL